MTAPVFVVGGGVSGIAAAHYLKSAGHQVELIERDQHLGGRVAPSQLADKPVELGGKNIGRHYKNFRAFTAELGDFAFEFFGINSSRIGKDGRIYTIDSKKRFKTFTGLLRTCPLRDLVRFAWLAKQVKDNPDNGYVGSDWFTAYGTTLNDPPLTKLFSEAFCQQIVRPMVVRMNGAEPDEAYAGNFGSNLRMLLDTYDQPTAGMQTIFSAFAKQLPIHLGTELVGLVTKNDQVTAVRVKTSKGSEEEWPCSGVVLATVASVTATLVADLLPKTADELRRVRYFPVQVAIVKYKQPIFNDQIRAITFGPEYAMSNAGAYGVDDLDIVRYTFSGRTARQAFTRGDDVEALITEAERHLGKYSENTPKPKDRVDFVERRWDSGLCAYAPHHHRVLHSVADAERTIKGLAFTGDYMRGASIEACFRAGKAAAQRFGRVSPKSAPLDERVGA